MEKTDAESAAGRATETPVAESEEARAMREAIEEMEVELVELDCDIAEARKGEKGEMSAIALENFLQLRQSVVEMIESNKKLYKVMLDSEAIERKLERGMK